MESSHGNGLGTWLTPFLGTYFKEKPPMTLNKKEAEAQWAPCALGSRHC